MENIYYFAYGSNMCENQMEIRCPDARKIGVGFLRGYELCISHYSKKWEGGVFNIQSKPKKMIWGTIWDLSNEDLQSLDYYEGYPMTYDRIYLDVDLVGTPMSKKIQKNCIVYKSNTVNPNIPISESYLELVKNAHAKNNTHLLFGG